MKINIDITDWNEEHKEKEPNVSSHKEIIERSKEGLGPSELARMTIVARELDLAPENIIASNKVNLMVGGAAQISKIKTGKKEAKLKNGNTVNMREYTCPVEGGEDDVLVESETKAGYDNAVNYLLNVVPGYIVGRLRIIANYSGNGDVEHYAELLIEKIRSAVKELV